MQRTELPLDELTLSEASAYMVIGSPAFRKGDNWSLLGATNLRQLSSTHETHKAPLPLTREPPLPLTAIAAKFGGHTRKKDSVSVSVS